MVHKYQAKKNDKIDVLVLYENVKLQMHHCQTKFQKVFEVSQS